MRQYVSTLSDIVDPSGRRATFDGAAWVSQDGKFWWNGTTWQPIAAQRRRIPWGVIGAVVVIMVIAAVVIHSVPRQLIDTNTYGATNAKIDSPVMIEFDYMSQDSCSAMVFVYTFYNAEGIKVTEFQDPYARTVNAGQGYHFTVAASQPIDPSATRFTVTPNCTS